MLGQGEVAPGWFRDPGMGGDQARSLIDLDGVLALAYLYTSADHLHGDGIAVGRNADITFDIHDALMQKVDRRHPDGQWFQERLLDGKEFSRAGLEFRSESSVHLVTPLASLTVGVLPVLEGATGQKVVFNIGKPPFDVSRTIGVPFLMGFEREVVAFAEGLHLRDGNHIASGPLEYYQLRVVDHAGGTAAAQVVQGVGKEHLAVKAREVGIELKEDHAGVAQNQRGRLHAALFATEVDHVR